MIVSADPKQGPKEVARHPVSTRGNPQIKDEHYPPRSNAGPLNRTPTPQTAEEKQFLALGEGARTWLLQAAAQGVGRIRTKIVRALSLSKVHGATAVDRALAAAALSSRFSDGDLERILIHQLSSISEQLHLPGTAHSLQPSTKAWGKLR